MGQYFYRDEDPMCYMDENVEINERRQPFKRNKNLGEKNRHYLKRTFPSESLKYVDKIDAKSQIIPNNGEIVECEFIQLSNIDYLYMVSIRNNYIVLSKSKMIGRIWKEKILIKDLEYPDYQATICCGKVFSKRWHLHYYVHDSPFIPFLLIISPYKILKYDVEKSMIIQTARTKSEENNKCNDIQDVSFQGKYFATCSEKYNGMIFIYSMYSLELLRKLNFEDGKIQKIVFSKKQPELIVGVGKFENVLKNRKRIQLFNWMEESNNLSDIEYLIEARNSIGDFVCLLSGNSESKNYEFLIALSHGSMYLAINEEINFESTIFIWNLDTGELLKQLKLPLGHYGIILGKKIQYFVYFCYKGVVVYSFDDLFDIDGDIREAKLQSFLRKSSNSVGCCGYEHPKFLKLENSMDSNIYFFSFSTSKIISWKFLKEVEDTSDTYDYIYKKNDEIERGWFFRQGDPIFKWVEKKTFFFAIKICDTEIDVMRILLYM